MSEQNGERKFNQRKELVLFIFGICGIIFVVAIMPVLNYEFHVEYLLAFLAVLGIPLARWGDKK